MLKKLCLRSVSAVVFLSALSTIAPSYGMDEKVKENGNEETPSQKQITVKPIEALNKEEKCFFSTFPNGVAQKIFSYLGSKDEAAIRRVCTKWRALSDTNPGSLRVRLDSDKAWKSNYEEFSKRVLAEDVLIWRMLDHLNPLGLLDQTKSMRGKIVVESVKSSSQLQEKLQDVLSQTGKTLGFLGEGNTLNYESLSENIKNVKNHPHLHQHLKALWLLNQCEKEKETVEKFSKAFDDFWPNKDGFRKKEEGLTKTEELDPQFEWLLKQPFWTAYTDESDMWFSIFVLYDALRMPSSKAEPIYSLYSQIFPYEKLISEIMRDTLYNVYDLKNEFEKQIDIYKGTSYLTMKDFFKLLQAYNHSHQYKEAINLFESTINNFKEKKIDIKDKAPNSFHFYLYTDYLQTILKSNVFLEYKKKAYEILKELQNATENTEKSNLFFVFTYEDGVNENDFNKDIEKKEVLFYENCLKYLFEEGSILNCLNEGANPEIVRDMVTHAGLEKFSKELLGLQKFFKEKCNEIFSETGKCEGSLRTDQLNNKDVKKWLSFGKLLFSNDKKTLKKYKKLVPELFQNEKEKK